jgi:predicted NodU family carbamoyl transferase
MNTHILGISAFYHDSAAVLLRDGKIVAAAQEERFTRQKGDARFPQRAIQYCLDEGGLDVSSIDHLVFYEQPKQKFERLLETYLSYAPKGYQSFTAAIRQWAGRKLDLPNLLLTGPLTGFAVLVYRPSRLARRKRVLSLSVRGSGGSHTRCGGRVGNQLHRHRARQQTRTDT